ncbi:hypothetical protein [Streptomyces sp. 147326]
MLRTRIAKAAVAAVAALALAALIPALAGQNADGDTHVTATTAWE